MPAACHPLAPSVSGWWPNGCSVCLATPSSNPYHRHTLMLDGFKGCQVQWSSACISASPAVPQHLVQDRVISPFKVHVQCLQVQVAVILAANILQLWAWTHGTSICGRLLGLWWEEPMLQHSASLSRISMACLADFIYTVSTLGLGGLVCLCSRIFTGRTIGERWAGVYMVHEGWQPYKGS